MDALLSRSDRGTVVFLIFKSLPYGVRIVISAILVLSGFAIQYVTYAVLPGLIPVLAGSLLLLVKGYDNRVTMGKYNPVVQWENISNAQVDKLLQMHKKIISWDRSALDITNVLGFWVFVILALILTFLFIRGSNLVSTSYNILAFDIMVLIVPHWFTGVRRILTMPVLLMKIKFLRMVQNAAQDKLKTLKINFMVQLRGQKKSKTLPYDMKLRVNLADPPAGFLGMYVQVNANDVNGTKYPYLYTVLVAEPEFDLKRKTQDYKPSKGIIREYSVQKEVDVLVIRQFTTYTGGYHTKTSTMQTIFNESLEVMMGLRA